MIAIQRIMLLLPERTNMFESKQGVKVAKILLANRPEENKSF
jgi:hypothetical protein